MSITVPTEELRGLKRHVAPFVAPGDRGDGPLGCIQVAVRQRRREYLACDSFRLVRWRSDVPAESNGSPTLVERNRLPTLTKVSGEVVLPQPLPPHDVYPSASLWKVLKEARQREDHVVATISDPKRVVARLRDLYPGKGSKAHPDVVHLVAGHHICLRLAHPNDSEQISDERQPAWWIAVNPRWLAQMLDATPGEVTLYGSVRETDPLRLVSHRWEALLMPVCGHEPGNKLLAEVAS